MLESKIESLRVEKIEIRVEALDSMNSEHGDTHEDSKLVSVQVLYDDYWGL